MIEMLQIDPTTTTNTKFLLSNDDEEIILVDILIQSLKKGSGLPLFPEIGKKQSTKKVISFFLSFFNKTPHLIDKISNK